MVRLTLDYESHIASYVLRSLNSVHKILKGILRDLENTSQRVEQPSKLYVRLIFHRINLMAESLGEVLDYAETVVDKEILNKKKSLTIESFAEETMENLKIIMDIVEKNFVRKEEYNPSILISILERLNMYADKAINFFEFHKKILEDLKSSYWLNVTFTLQNLIEDLQTIKKGNYEIIEYFKKL